MGDGKDIALTISQDVVKPIVDAKIQAAIVAALGDGTDLIRAAVAKALEVRVDRDGNISRYDSDNKYPYMEAVCERLIRESTGKALAAWVEENKPKIEAELKKVLSKSGNKLAAALAAGLLESVKSDVKHTVNITFDTPRRY
jgi:hypothetical protein